MPIQRTENSGVKTVAKAAAATVATAAVATGAALYLARTGKLDQFVGKNKVADQAINGAKGLADDIVKFAEPKIAAVRPAVENAIKTVKDSKVFKSVAKFADDAAKFVKGIYTNSKAAVTRFFSEKNPADTVVEAMAGKFN